MIGIIVEESLKDNRFLNRLDVLSVEIADAEESQDRWHLYKVKANEIQIKELAKELKSQKWYSHFWDKKKIVVVFPGKVFKIDQSDKSSWRPAINYGLSLKIPAEQLDFVVEED
jgi:hypothetical protein